MPDHMHNTDQFHTIILNDYIAQKSLQYQCQHV